MACEFCDGDGGPLIFASERWRVVRVTGADSAAYPGFCRVIWNAHAREMTDLAEHDRNEFMRAVFKVEAALRKALSPHKMNIASLGNLTPHLHWHVIPRYEDDPAFPKPVWAVSLPTEKTISQSAPRLDKLSGKPDRSEAATGSWEDEVRRTLGTM